MTWLSRLLIALRGPWATPEAVRREAWALGARHQGEVLDGARAELKASRLPWRRTLLLRAVIRSQLRARLESAAQVP